MPELSVKNICYIVNNNNEVLLQFKRKGFGIGKWNGPGGKVEPGETSEQAVIREVKEETGLDIIKPKLMAELEFIFLGHDDWSHVAHAYVAKNYSGEIVNSDEGELKWFKINDLPFKEMWEDDPHWLPRVFGGQFMKMRFCFDENGKLLKYENL